MKERKLIECIDCLIVFEFTPGEQQFFSSKGLAVPKRCPECRKKRRNTIAKPNDGAQNG